MRRGRGDYLDAASARQEVCCSITPIVSKLQLLSIIVVSLLRVGLPCGNRKRVLGSRSGDAAALRRGSAAPRSHASVTHRLLPHQRRFSSASDRVVYLPAAVR